MVRDDLRKDLRLRPSVRQRDLDALLVVLLVRRELVLDRELRIKRLFDDETCFFSVQDDEKTLDRREERQYPQEEAARHGCAWSALGGRFGGRARRLARARRLLWRVLLLLACMRSAVARGWRSAFWTAAATVNESRASNCALNSGANA